MRMIGNRHRIAAFCHATPLLLLRATFQSAVCPMIHCPLRRSGARRLGGDGRSTARQTAGEPSPAAV
jgi:hypothetical protein